MSNTPSEYYFRFGSAILQNGRQWFFKAPQAHRKSVLLAILSCNQVNHPIAHDTAHNEYAQGLYIALLRSKHFGEKG